MEVLAGAAERCIKNILKNNPPLLDWLLGKRERRGALRGEGGGGIIPLTLANHRAQGSILSLHPQEIQRKLIFFTLPSLHISPRTTTASKEQRIVGVAKELEFLHGCSPLAAGKFSFRTKIGSAPHASELPDPCIICENLALVLLDPAGVHLRLCALFLVP